MVAEEPVYEVKDPYSGITGVGDVGDVGEPEAYEDSVNAENEEDDHEHADLESQLDDMISLLNDGIDYQRDLAKTESPELVAEVPPPSIHNDRATMWGKCEAKARLDKNRPSGIY